MVIGFLYKRFMSGAKGWEQIPFINTYREFGDLEAVSIMIIIIIKLCYTV